MNGHCVNSVRIRRDVLFRILPDADQKTPTMDTSYPVGSVLKSDSLRLLSNPE